MKFVKFLLAAITVIVVGMIGFVYLAPEKATIFAINADRHRSDLLRKEIDLPDGLHYVYFGGR